MLRTALDTDINAERQVLVYVIEQGRLEIRYLR